VGGAAVYLFYFIFSLNQTTDVLTVSARIGRDTDSPAPHAPWLYLRVLMVLIREPADVHPRSRLSHGVWFYFPVVFVLKSPLSFLGLLALAAALG